MASARPIISAGLHGREIRAVKMKKLFVWGEIASFRTEWVTIVATAAENGVLAISRRTLLLIFSRLAINSPSSSY